jgi:urease accessory protein
MHDHPHDHHHDHPHDHSHPRPHPALTVARLLPSAPAQAHDLVVLDYDARLIRRKRLETVQGLGFMVDLPQVTNLDGVWGFELSDGTCVEVVAADEDLVAVTGPNLPRLAWHIGNRHTPCQIEPARLLIRRDHVIEAMLVQQGAILSAVCEPFTPEGGAYGHGRTMGHSHGPDETGHAHAHSHD